MPKPFAAYCVLLPQAVPGSISRRSAAPSQRGRSQSASAQPAYAYDDQYNMPYAPDEEDEAAGMYEHEQQLPSFAGFMPPPSADPRAMSAHGRQAQMFMPSMPMAHGTPLMPSAAPAPRRIEFTSAAHTHSQGRPYEQHVAHYGLPPQQPAMTGYGAGAGYSAHGRAASESESASSTGTSELGGPAFPRRMPTAQGQGQGMYGTGNAGLGRHSQSAGPVGRGPSPGRQGQQPNWLSSGTMLGQRRQSAAGGKAAAQSILGGARPH